MKRFAVSLLVIFLWMNTSAQEPAGSLPKFRDNLLDHLVGTWDVASVAHGFSSTATIKGEWTLNHQIFHIHFIGKEVIPWIGVPMEFNYFIGYNHKQDRYVVHGTSVFGSDDDEGFWYGSRKGNELELVQKPIITATTDTFNVQRLTWKPDTKTWIVQSEHKRTEKKPMLF